MGPRRSLMAAIVSTALMTANAAGAPVGATTLPTTDTSNCTEIHDIRVNAGSSTAHGPLHIALENGYFEDVCLNPIRSSMNSSQDVSLAVVADQVDISPVSTAVLLSVWNAGLPITAVTASSRGGDRIAIVVGVDSGIETIEDLAGRTISVQVGALGHQILLAALTSVGLTIDDVEILNAPTTDTPALIATNQVDAVGTFEPYATAMEENGTGRVLVRGADLMGNSVNFLMVRDSYLEESPEVVQAAVQAVYRGMQFLREQPEAASEILGEVLEVNPGDILKQLPYYIWNPLMDDDAMESVASDGAFLLETGVIDSVPDFHFDQSVQESIIAEHPELIADLDD